MIEIKRQLIYTTTYLTRTRITQYYICFHIFFTLLQ